MKKHQRQSRRQHEEARRPDGRHPPDTPSPLPSLKPPSPQAGAFHLQALAMHLIAKFTKSAAITRSLLNRFFFVRASCSLRSAPFAFVDIVEPFIAIVVAVVARPYPDTPSSTAL